MKSENPPLSLPEKNVRIIRILMGLFQSINVSVNDCSTKLRSIVLVPAIILITPPPSPPDLIGRGKLKEEMVSVREEETAGMFYLACS